MFAKAILALAPLISEVLSPLARNIGHKLGETLSNKSQQWVEYLIPDPNQIFSDSTEIEQAKQRYSQEMIEYGKAKDARDNELLKLTVAQTARRLELQEQEQQDRLKLAALQRDLMRDLQAKDIQVKLAEIQTIWDKDTWFSKLNREETKQILLQQQHRLLILLSPPKISKRCPETFCEDLPIEMRSVGDFLRQHYPQQDVLRPVKFYSDYFTESIGDIDVERLQRILFPVPTTILYSDISDYAVTFRVGFWGFLNNQEVSLFSTKVFDWEEAKDALLASGVSEKKALRIIRQLIVAIHKLLAGFLADLYYLNIDPSYEPLLFNLKDELAEYGLAEEWGKPYFDILQDIQRRQGEQYEEELKKLIEQVEAERQSQEAAKAESQRQQQIEEAAKAEAQRQKQIEEVFTRKVQSFKCVKTLNGVGKSSVDCVVISPDGKTFATDSRGNCSKFWNLHTGELIRTFSWHSDAVYCVAINHNGKILASGSYDKTIKLWNLETGQEISTLKGHSILIRSLAFSQDGQTLVSGSGDHTIRLWNLKTGQQIRTLTGHSNSVWSVAISPDGETIVSGSWDKTIKLWNLKTRQEICTLTGHSKSVYSVAISPDGQTLASGSCDNTIKLWNLKKGNEIRTLTGHSDYVKSVAISPDGQTLASGSFDNTIKLWNLKTGQEICTLTGHSDNVNSVSFSPDGNTIVSGSNDESIKIWRCDG
ncbi:serine/threonine protein kinase [Microcoleus vaginatus]|uniref:serine/threonine protein kinase n=1 Tax=Microcoleus vaginatus TaxID=119532 RepID=UPI001688F9EA|nr:serine/threonine protein kinase [Microcoleus sp. FACHB-84]MBD2009260.1 serine/threonine protein kinase [Microcoleus sp. FACHB-45]